MVWMKTFCFTRSVRFGALITIFLCFLQGAIPLLILLMYTTPTYLKEQAFHIMEEEHEYTHHIFLDKLLDYITEDPQQFTTIVMVSLAAYLVCCVVAAIGTLRLIRVFLIPFILMELFRDTILFVSHVVAMMVLKKMLNLGTLIAATVAGGFVLLFILYLWASVVALFQIIHIVKSQKYISLYGNDPLAPWDDENGVLDDSIENVRMYKTPNFEKITPLKPNKGVGPNKLAKQNTVATIPINEPDIQLAVKEYQNWHANELMKVKKSNILRFY